jgi:predicted enzyme related to lactoylglutathione lyase
METLAAKVKQSTRVLTLGMTHIALKVKDIERTIQFYQHVFNVRIMYRKANFAQVTTPGSNDIIVFERSKSPLIGNTGGIAHFGFRLNKPEDIDEITTRVIEAGGLIKEEGEFVPGEPYLFLIDPNGYEIEVWYELPM